MRTYEEIKIRRERFIEELKLDEGDDQISAIVETFEWILQESDELDLYLPST